MKLLGVLLFLGSSLLPSRTAPVPQDVDCNDSDVFKAVDRALRWYNEHLKDGNQFLLYRVTEASMTTDSDTFYSLKYQIREGDCPVQKDKHWQDCDYREAAEAATGECTATVKTKNKEKFTVSLQTCQITPAEGPVITAHYECSGCIHPISPTSTDLIPILKHGLQHFNNRTNHPFLFRVNEVKKAQRQVVSGWNFDVHYTIIQTNCSKQDFEELLPDCKPMPGGDTGDCSDKAFVDPHMKITGFVQNCELFPGAEWIPPPDLMCAGCPQNLPVDSPELKEPLKHSLDKVNSADNYTFYFKVETIRKATFQLVAGQKFSIEFLVRQTRCSKEDNEKMPEDCEVDSNGSSFLKRPPGFSPFRSVQTPAKEGSNVSPPQPPKAPDREEEQAPGKRRGHPLGHDSCRGRGPGQGRGRGCKRARDHERSPECDRGQGKHRNKDRPRGKPNGGKKNCPEDNSNPSRPEQIDPEEPGTPPSILRPTHQPRPEGAVTLSYFRDSDLLSPDTPLAALPPSDGDLFPEIQSEPKDFSLGLLDFPEPPPPKCPGRPWKPIQGMDPATEEKQYDDFDLFDAVR
ncbi:kininogen-1 isoform X2 [Ornithorhynchus anatinus]|uniref:kininogen-1 isoform X2 n=1 Tax=Ornithorhynchus anatinus TaxID=9258 RepID=UPI0010A8CDEF|nr:kininogen-1 isoform X2 [Ornithorhynchus anatinus]